VHPHLAAVIDRLNSARADLRTAVDAVPASVRNRRPAPDRWSVAEVLEHLSLVERLFTTRVTDAIAAVGTLGVERAAERVPLPAEIEAIIANRENKRTAPDPAHPRAGLDADAAWAAVERSRAALLDTLRAADGLALSEVQTSHPAFGALTVYQMSELIAGHEARHAAQIREIAAAV
jgi:hypothetical protein